MVEGERAKGLEGKGRAGGGDGEGGGVAGGEVEEDGVGVFRHGVEDDLFGC